MRVFRPARSRVSFRVSGGDAFTWSAALCAPRSTLTCLYHRKWRGLYRKLARLSTGLRYGTILTVIVFLVSLLFLATTIKV